MANGAILAEHMKHIQDEMIENVLTYGFSAMVLKPRDMMANPVFRWYRGHDPYNSADDQAFMERLTDGDSNND